jgi:hypothetical protein
MAEEEVKAPMQEMTTEQKEQLMRGGKISEIAQQETPTPEVPEEPKPIDTPDEPTVDDKGGAAPETPLEVPQEFDIEFFNKQFSTEFTDEDGVKEALKSIQEIEGLKKQVGTIASKDEELEVLRTEADPMKYFASEDDYRVAQFKRTFPDKDPAMVAKLFSTDLSQANDFDVLTWMAMLDNPDLIGGESGARELVADVYGVDDISDLSGMDSLTKNKLKVNAKKEMDRVKDMKADIKLPEKRDYETIKEERQAAQLEKTEKLNSDWKTIAAAVVKEYPDFVINNTDKDGNETEAFRYKVGGDMTEDNVKPIVEGFIKAGIPVDEKSAQALGVALQKDFLYRNRDKILLQAIKDASAKQEEQTLEEEHNPGKPNENERNTGGKPNLSDQILQDLRSGGLQAKRAN